MSASQKEKGEKLFKKGKGILGKWIYLGDRYGDACNHLNRAANTFKMIKEYERAADCYKETVVAFLKEDSPYEAGNAWLQASNMYLKADECEKKAVHCLKQAVEAYLESGKYNRAAKAEDQLGDVLSRMEKYEEAIEHLQSAADYFETDNLRTASYDAKKKVGHLYATVGDYEKAIDTFEGIADYMVNDKVLKWNAKQFYYKTILCKLAQAGKELDEEIENVKENFEMYKEKDVYLDGTNESEFIEAVLEAVSDENLKSFSIACKKHERLLDNWTTKIMLRIKKNMESNMEENQ